MRILPSGLGGRAPGASSTAGLQSNITGSSSGGRDGSSSFAGKLSTRAQCAIDTRGSVFETPCNCSRLTNVCLDQGNLILYDDRFQALAESSLEKLSGKR